MKYNNQEIVEAFVNGEIHKGTANNIFVEGNVLYSYGEHFPMAIKLYDDEGDEGNAYFIINKGKYSVTTSRHQCHLRNALIKYNIPEKRMMSEESTSRMIHLVRQNIKTLREAIAERLLISGNIKVG